MRSLEEILNIINSEVRRLLPEFGTHGLEHTERVYKLCLDLGKKVEADLSILLPAALLHDVGRGKADHAAEGAELARRVLYSIGYAQDKIEAVVEAISAHSFTGGISPDSLEAQILSDADKLDAIGAFGIYRAAMYSGEHGRRVEGFIAHFHDKLLKLKDQLFTGEARQLAESRHRFMQEFLTQIEREMRINQQT